MGNNMGSTVEICYKIWDDKFGSRIEIGDDSDGLDMLQISAIESDNKKCQFVLFKLEDAEAIATSIIEVAKHIRSRKNNLKF